MINRFVDWVVPAYIPAAQEYVERPGPPEHKYLFFEQMMLDPGHRVLTHPKMPAIGPIMQETFNAIRDGVMPVRSALIEANRRINALLQESESE